LHFPTGRAEGSLSKIGNPRRVKIMNNKLNILILLLLSGTLLTTGCVRKNIETEPPVKHTPAQSAKPAPIKKTVKVEKKFPKNKPGKEDRELLERDLKKFQPAAHGLAYIQVGAFADRVGAKAVTSALIADGYKGSRFSKDEADGYFRVQAGVFPDRETAERALKKLRLDYPGSFIIMEPTKKEAQ